MNAKVSNSCFSIFLQKLYLCTRLYVSLTNKPQYSQELPLYWLKQLGWYCCIHTGHTSPPTGKKTWLALKCYYQNTEAYGNAQKNAQSVSPNLCFSICAASITISAVSFKEFIQRFALHMKLSKSKMHQCWQFQCEATNALVF